MFQYFRLKVPQFTSDDRRAGEVSEDWLSHDASIPISIRQINNLPEPVKFRIYRGLLSPNLLTKYRIDPLSWESRNGRTSISLRADADSMVATIRIFNPKDVFEELMALEIQDNAFDSVDLNLIVIADPDAERFAIDRDELGDPTMFGTLKRNLQEEERAYRNGLAPGQTRKGLGGSKATLDQLEAFLAALGHRAYFLEPLSYASACLFERRGFAYVRGHQLMEEINREFQPGGVLFIGLDASTPFRQPDQWRTVRGRAWAIHDGILERIDRRWDQIRMVKQIGREAEIATFPQAEY